MAILGLPRLVSAERSRAGWQFHSDAVLLVSPFGCLAIDQSRQENLLTRTCIDVIQLPALNPSRDCRLLRAVLEHDRKDRWRNRCLCRLPFEIVLTNDCGCSGFRPGLLNQLRCPVPRPFRVPLTVGLLVVLRTVVSIDAAAQERTVWSVIATVETVTRSVSAEFGSSTIAAHSDACSWAG